MEAIGAAGGVGGAAWTFASNFLPGGVQWAGNSTLAAIGATLGVVVWWRHKQAKREDDGNEDR